MNVGAIGAGTVCPHFGQSPDNLRLKIGHYGIGLWDVGGVASYVRRIGLAQRAAGHDVVFLDSRPTPVNFPVELQAQVAPTDQALYDAALSLGLDVLHLHSGVFSAPPVGLKENIQENIQGQVFHQAQENIQGQVFHQARNLAIRDLAVSSPKCIILVN